MPRLFPAVLILPVETVDERNLPSADLFGNRVTCLNQASHHTPSSTLLTTWSARSATARSVASSSAALVEVTPDPVK